MSGRRSTLPGSYVPRGPHGGSEVRRHSDQTSILDELNVERVGKRIQLLLDEKISVQEIRLPETDVEGNIKSKKHEISASTLTLGYANMHEDTKAALKGSERARILAARTMKELMLISLKGGKEKQARLITKIKMIDRDLDLHTVEKPTAMIAAMHEEFTHLTHHRVNRIKDKILTSQMTHPCSPNSTYLLDAIVAYANRVKELISAYYTAKYNDAGERATALRGGSDGSREYTRAILRQVTMAVGNAGALVGEAINMQNMATQYAGDLSTAVPTVLLERMSEQANDRINQLALTSGETIGGHVRLHPKFVPRRQYTGTGGDDHDAGRHEYKAPHGRKGAHRPTPRNTPEHGDKGRRNRGPRKFAYTATDNKSGVANTHWNQKRPSQHSTRAGQKGPAMFGPEAQSFPPHKSKMRDTDNRKCYNCDRTGHLIASCPHDRVPKGDSASTGKKSNSQYRGQRTSKEQRSSKQVRKSGVTRNKIAAYWVDHSTRVTSDQKSAFTIGRSISVDDSLEPTEYSAQESDSGSVHFRSDWSVLQQFPCRLPHPQVLGAPRDPAGVTTLKDVAVDARVRDLKPVEKTAKFCAHPHTRLPVVDCQDLAEVIRRHFPDEGLFNDVKIRAFLSNLGHDDVDTLNSACGALGINPKNPENASSDTIETIVKESHNAVNAEAILSTLGRAVVHKAIGAALSTHVPECDHSCAARARDPVTTARDIQEVLKDINTNPDAYRNNPIAIALWYIARHVFGELNSTSWVHVLGAEYATAGGKHGAPCQLEKMTEQVRLNLPIPREFSAQDTLVPRAPANAPKSASGADVIRTAQEMLQLYGYDAARSTEAEIHADANRRVTGLAQSLDAFSTVLKMRDMIEDAKDIRGSSFRTLQSYLNLEKHLEIALVFYNGTMGNARRKITVPQPRPNASACAGDGVVRLDYIDAWTETLKIVREVIPVVGSVLRDETKDMEGGAARLMIGGTFGHRGECMKQHSADTDSSKLAEQYGVLTYHGRQNVIIDGKNYKGNRIQDWTTINIGVYSTCNICTAAGLGYREGSPNRIVAGTAVEQGSCEGEIARSIPLCSAHCHKCLKDVQVGNLNKSRNGDILLRILGDTDEETIGTLIAVGEFLTLGNSFNQLTFVKEANTTAYDVSMAAKETVDPEEGSTDSEGPAWRSPFITKLNKKGKVRIILKIDDAERRRRAITTVMTSVMVNALLMEGKQLDPRANLHNILGSTALGAGIGDLNLQAHQKLGVPTDRRLHYAPPPLVAQLAPVGVGGPYSKKYCDDSEIMCAVLSGLVWQDPCPTEKRTALIGAARAATTVLIPGAEHLAVACVVRLCETKTELVHGPRKVRDSNGKIMPVCSFIQVKGRIASAEGVRTDDYGKKVPIKLNKSSEDIEETFQLVSKYMSGDHTSVGLVTTGAIDDEGRCMVVPLIINGMTGVLFDITTSISNPRDNLKMITNMSAYGNSNTNRQHDMSMHWGQVQHIQEQDTLQTALMISVGGGNSHADLTATFLNKPALDHQSFYSFVEEGLRPCIGIEMRRHPLDKTFIDEGIRERTRIKIGLLSPGCHYRDRSGTKLYCTKDCDCRNRPTVQLYESGHRPALPFNPGPGRIYRTYSGADYQTGDLAYTTSPVPEGLNDTLLDIDLVDTCECGLLTIDEHVPKGECHTQQEVHTHCCRECDGPYSYTCLNGIMQGEAVKIPYDTRTELHDAIDAYEARNGKNDPVSQLDDNVVRSLTSEGNYNQSEYDRVYMLRHHTDVNIRRLQNSHPPPGWIHAPPSCFTPTPRQHGDSMQQRSEAFTGENGTRTGGGPTRPEAHEVGCEVVDLVGERTNNKNEEERMKQKQQQKKRNESDTIITKSGRFKTKRNISPSSSPDTLTRPMLQLTHLPVADAIAHVEKWLKLVRSMYLTVFHRQSLPISLGVRYTLSMLFQHRLLRHHETTEVQELTASQLAFGVKLIDTINDHTLGSPEIPYPCGWLGIDDTSAWVLESKVIRLGNFGTICNTLDDPDAEKAMEAWRHTIAKHPSDPMRVTSNPLDDLFPDQWKAMDERGSCTTPVHVGENAHSAHSTNPKAKPPKPPRDIGNDLWKKGPFTPIESKQSEAEEVSSDDPMGNAIMSDVSNTSTIPTPTDIASQNFLTPPKGERGKPIAESEAYVSLLTPSDETLSESSSDVDTPCTPPSRQVLFRDAPTLLRHPMPPELLSGHKKIHWCNMMEMQMNSSESAQKSPKANYTNGKVQPTKHLSILDTGASLHFSGNRNLVKHGIDISPETRPVKSATGSAKITKLADVQLHLYPVDESGSPEDPIVISQEIRYIPEMQEDLTLLSTGVLMRSLGKEFPGPPDGSDRPQLHILHGEDKWSYISLTDHQNKRRYIPILEDNDIYFAKVSYAHKGHDLAKNVAVNPMKPRIRSAGEPAYATSTRDAADNDEIKPRRTRPIFKATLDILHYAFAHCGLQALTHTISRSPELEATTKSVTNCASCYINKSTREFHDANNAKPRRSAVEEKGHNNSGNTTIVRPTFEETQYDICQEISLDPVPLPPSTYRGYEGYKWVWLMVDRRSRYMFAEFSIRKDANTAADIITRLTKQVAQFGWDLNTLKHDGEKSLKDPSVNLVCDEHNIRNVTCLARSPNTNRIEQMVRHIKDKVRCTLHAAQLPIAEFWIPAMKDVIHKHNTISMKALDWKSPYELVHRHLPKMHRVRAFGSMAYVVKPHDKRTQKVGSLAPYAVPCLVLEEATDRPGWNIWRSDGKEGSPTQHLIIHDLCRPRDKPPSMVQDLGHLIPLPKSNRTKGTEGIALDLPDSITGITKSDGENALGDWSCFHPDWIHQDAKTMHIPIGLPFCKQFTIGDGSSVWYRGVVIDSYTDPHGVNQHTVKYTDDDEEDLDSSEITRGYKLWTHAISSQDADVPHMPTHLFTHDEEEVQHDIDDSEGDTLDEDAVIDDEQIACDDDDEINADPADSDSANEGPIAETKSPEVRRSTRARRPRKIYSPGDNDDTEDSDDSADHPEAATAVPVPSQQNTGNMALNVIYFVTDDDDEQVPQGHGNTGCDGVFEIDDDNHVNLCAVRCGYDDACAASALLYSGASGQSVYNHNTTTSPVAYAAGKALSYRTAMRSQHKTDYKAAADKEINQLDDLDVLRYVTKKEMLRINKDAVPLLMGWALVRKIDSLTGQVKSTKGRAYLRGDMSIPDRDYCAQSVYSNTVSIDAVKLSLGLAAARDHKILSFDVSGAFLQSRPSRTVFVKLPEGYRRVDENNEELYATNTRFIR